MSRIFITGSADGLGLAAARTLIDEGHTVILHARSKQRAAEIGKLAERAAGVVTGDLSSAIETKAVADQVNQLGTMDAVIHNAGVYLITSRADTPEGHARTIAVNVLAPYLLTAWIARPQRLVYITSGLHRSGGASLDDIDWIKRRWDADQAYADSKLQVATLAAAVARRWPGVLSNAVDPGWVPTKMGGPAASDDLEMGHLTQTWLAVSGDVGATVSGGYWHHRRQQEPADKVNDVSYQDGLMEQLAALTGTRLF